MNDRTSALRTCEVCGDPLRPDNKTGICSGRGKPECAKARDRRRNRPSQPHKPWQKPARTDAEIRLCEVCGTPLRCDNEVGICTGRGKPECRQARRRRMREAIARPEQSGYIKAGDKFGRWTALEDYSRDNRDVLVRCGCERRTEKRIRGKFLVSGENRSCGCLRSEPRKGKPPYLKAGSVSGRLTVLEDVARMTDQAPCRCACGNKEEVTPRAGNIKNGITRSCGCLSRERTATRGGLSRHYLYSVWNSMIDRCTNPKVKGYHNYGGRGIKVCDRWLDLGVFIEDVEREIGPRPAGVRASGRVLYSFDRKDNDGNYEPGNICWSTSAQQVMNQRKVAKLTLDVAALVRERDALVARVAELEGRQP